jgi:hypothetical protein
MGMKQQWEKQSGKVTLTERKFSSFPRFGFRMQDMRKPWHLLKKPC